MKEGGYSSVNCTATGSTTVERKRTNDPSFAIFATCVWRYHYSGVFAVSNLAMV